MNVVLIGYRGTGKSTVARILAERLGWPWFDSDERIESLAKRTIAEIFADDGEEAFRDWETQVVRDLATRQQCVLALGGGAVLREANRGALANSGRVVWLTAPPEVLWQRIREDHGTAARRPSLTPQGGITEITATLAAREPIYRQCADAVVDTCGRTPEEVVGAILEQLKLPRS
jgi:shikimate kinase